MDTISTNLVSIVDGISFLQFELAFIIGILIFYIFFYNFRV